VILQLIRFTWALSYLALVILQLVRFPWADNTLFIFQFI